MPDPVQEQQFLQYERLKQLEEERIRLEEEKQALMEKALKLKGTWQGQCVVAARKFIDATRDDISGRARDLQVNSDIPEIGAIIKLNMSKVGHVGIVLDETETTIIYYDSNGSWTQRASIREIKKDDPKILGYKIIN